MTDATPPFALHVNHLSYEYSDGYRALEDVTFDVKPGERVGLVGPSGAGKSTLLMHLNGLLPNPLPTKSSENGSAMVSVNGLAVSGIHLSTIRRDVGFLFQDPDDQLFCPTVAEDVAFGPLNLGLPTDEIHRRIVESLDAVGLAGFEKRSTMRLSVGERKRVCLAGLLACRPSVLALDEPSSNLDPRARRRLMTYLAEFPGSQIIATHDLDFVVEHCQRVLILDGGRIHADG
ncbi:MAG: ABC transporter ATP-binding protein, partial [Planctomycetaceae bacterium]|nr:ABC transporter ATP-binding protein [Planctomycetaceae bacterium]